MQARAAAGPPRDAQPGRSPATCVASAAGARTGIDHTPLAGGSMGAAMAAAAAAATTQLGVGEAQLPTRRSTLLALGPKLGTPALQLLQSATAAVEGRSPPGGHREFNDDVQDISSAVGGGEEMIQRLGVKTGRGSGAIRLTESVCGAATAVRQT